MREAQKHPDPQHWLYMYLSFYIPFQVQGTESFFRLRSQFADPEMAQLEKAFVTAVAEKRGIRGSVLPPDIRATARLLTLALEEAKLDYKRLMTMATTGRVADRSALNLMRIRIFSNCGSGSSSGSRVWMTKN
jgi:hypothetical protein